jgi:hypothetical protein
MFIFTILIICKFQPRIDLIMQTKNVWKNLQIFRNEWARNIKLGLNNLYVYSWGQLKRNLRIRQI